MRGGADVEPSGKRAQKDYAPALIPPPSQDDLTALGATVVSPGRMDEIRANARSLAKQFTKHLREAAPERERRARRDSVRRVHEHRRVTPYTYSPLQTPVGCNPQKDMSGGPPRDYSIPDQVPGLGHEVELRLGSISRAANGK